jgi:hypothetical protein
MRLEDQYRAGRLGRVLPAIRRWGWSQRRIQLGLPGKETAASLLSSNVGRNQAIETEEGTMKNGRTVVE